MHHLISITHMSKPHLIRYSPKTLLLTIIVAKFKVKPFLIIIKYCMQKKARDFLARRLLHFVQLTSFSVWNFAYSKSIRFTLRHLSRIFVDDAMMLHAYDPSSMERMVFQRTVPKKTP